MLGGIFLYLVLTVVCWIFPPTQKPAKSKPKYRMKEVENEGELFFTDATDFDEAFKL